MQSLDEFPSIGAATAKRAQSLPPAPPQPQSHQLPPKAKLRRVPLLAMGMAPVRAKGAAAARGSGAGPAHHVAAAATVTSRAARAAARLE